MLVLDKLWVDAFVYFVLIEMNYEYDGCLDDKVAL